MQAILQLHSRSTSVCLRNVDADESGLEEPGILSSALSSGPTSSRMPRSAPDRVCRVSSRLLAGTISHCSAMLRVCQIMYRPKQFCAWHATSKTEFHPTQTGTDHGAVLPSPGCTRFVQTVVCLLETPSTAPRIGPCGEVRYGLLGLALTTTTTTML